jgi:hypothetical protein
MNRHTLRECDAKLRIRNLPSRFYGSAELPHYLDSMHTRWKTWSDVATREESTVRVHRQASSKPDRTILDVVCAFADLAES